MNELQTAPKNAALFVIPGRASSREPGIQHHALLWIPGSLAKRRAPRNDGARKALIA
jgi:hypothetical protein